MKNVCTFKKWPWCIWTNQEFLRPTRTTRLSVIMWTTWGEPCSTFVRGRASVARSTTGERSGEHFIEHHKTLFVIQLCVLTVWVLRIENHRCWLGLTASVMSSINHSILHHLIVYTNWCFSQCTVLYIWVTLIRVYFHDVRKKKLKYWLSLCRLFTAMGTWCPGRESYLRRAGRKMGKPRPRTSWQRS